MDSFSRRVLRWHFWAGLLVCPTLLVVALTGAIYTFRDEIEDGWYADTTFVTPVGNPKLASELLAAVQTAYPGRTVSRMVLAVDPSRSTAFLVNRPPRPDGADPGPSDLVSVNPYTGAVLGERSNRSPVFGPVLDIHRRLFAGTPGRWAVELTTAWTLVLLATGMWLWVPRTWRKVTGVWVPRVRGRRYAVLRDWHTVVGLYLVPAVALIAFTGLLYGVGSKRLWDAATGGAASPPFKSFLRSPPSTVPSAAVPTVSVDVPVAMARERWPDSPLKVLFPRKPTDPYELTALGGSGPLSVGVLGLDRYTGAVLADNHYAALPWYERARMWALPIHQGTVYGTATKVLAVLACIGLAGLAVSGVWLWLDRRRPGRSGFPRAATGAVPMAGVVSILVFAVLLPSVGASLMVVLVGEWLVGRIARQPVKSSKELSS